MDRPGVGIGLIIENEAGEILIGKRVGSHAAKYSIFGGSIELGETFEAAAIREAQEELGITLVDPVVTAITNNLETYREDGIHFCSVILHTRNFIGQPRIMEPSKCAELGWYAPRQLPEPHFDASRFAIRCFLEDAFYLGSS